ncbi:acyl-CoA dehydrogenase family protein [Pseudonocardia sp. NPDC046786]|uniref:acyl-CoA dehydrogenase family protein n=1 Tax=Pseudonocardia sp. NPDC046786 TaxID=3155471 RepID=UPI00340562A5
MPLTTEELREFRAVTRSFVRDRLQPLEHAMDAEDRLPDRTWQELAAASVELGLWTANMAEASGGPGLTLGELSSLWEEFGHTAWPFTYLLGRPHATLAKCTPEQRKKYLDPLVSRQAQYCFAVTEPGAGSDVAAMRTTAKQVHGGFVINGVKHFITHGGDADFVILFAVTDRKEGQRKPEMTAFLVDRGTAGFTVGGKQDMMGWRGLHEHELIFEDCFVPDDQVLGEQGEGMRLAMAGIAQRRLNMAAFSCGMMDRLITLSHEYAQNRVVFGEALTRKQGIQWMLAEMEALRFSARATTFRVCELCDEARASGMDDFTLAGQLAKEVAVAKLVATQALGRVADMAVQIFGGMGWSKENPVERMFRDARILRIVDGTDEVQKGIVFRNLTGRRDIA